ncbi:hypothetical protein BC835DRAFT_302564 [Cytidiella melzeri]|nr:hypothetical protein BC835DRAFT_302564 [Cytidiella melzeri]
MLTLWKSALALQISSPVPESDNFIKTLKLCLFSMCLSVIMRRKPILRTMWTDLFEFFTQRIQEFDQMTLKNSPQMDEIEISGLATSCLESIRQEEILRKYLNSYDVELRQRDCSVGWDSEQKMVAGWRTPPLLSPYSEQLILTLERFALPSWYQPVGIPVWLR